MDETQRPAAWLRWMGGAIVGTGLIALVGIPFVDATRVVPTGAASGLATEWFTDPPEAYEYRLEVRGDELRLDAEVRIDRREVTTNLRSCNVADERCERIVADFAGIDRILATTGRLTGAAPIGDPAAWTVEGPLPELSGRYDEPDRVGEEVTFEVEAFEVLTP